MHPSDNTPVLIGGGQSTYKLPFEETPSPIEMMVEVAGKAAENAGANKNILEKIDTVAVVQMVVESMQNMKGLELGKYTNIPKSLGDSLGANLRKGYYAYTGGNTPQQYVNFLAEQISQEKSEFALLAGCENLRSVTKSLKAGKPLQFNDDPGGEAIPFGDSRDGCTEHERQYGLFAPINTYPLFENALRGHRGRSVEEHMSVVGKLMSSFTKVASENPHAWFPTNRTAEEIITPTENNRYIGFPYTKYLNSIIEVDMAAAVLMCSIKTAKKYGIPEDRWVYLNGCGDAYDHFYLSERCNYYSSPAIKRIAEESFRMAGISLEDINHIDIYSCFPSAVEVACDAIGLAEDDPRGLTVTGGLPYFGGPGNNYVTHSIAEMLDKVRKKQGSHGLVTGNGWHLTKHSMGLYSTEPNFEDWQRESSKVYQDELDQIPAPSFTEQPEGNASIETYTVTHAGNQPRNGIVIGRLEDGTRFISKTSKDLDLLNDMKDQDYLGRTGSVSQMDGVNIFSPS